MPKKTNGTQKSKCCASMECRRSIKLRHRNLYWVESWVIIFFDGKERLKSS